MQSWDTNKTLNLTTTILEQFSQKIWLIFYIYHSLICKGQILFILFALTKWVYMCDDPNSISFSFWTTSIYSTSSKDIAFILEQISALFPIHNVVVNAGTLYYLPNSSTNISIWILYYNTNNVILACNSKDWYLPLNSSLNCKEEFNISVTCPRRRRNYWSFLDPPSASSNLSNLFFDIS